MGAFHAYDIRGIYNRDFNKETVYKIGFFIPRLLKTDKVLVGRDVRVSSPEIHKALLDGLTDAGATVYDLGLATTPMVYFATGRHNFDASIQITASHNPREYNGMKISGRSVMPIGLDNGLGTLQEWLKREECIISACKGGIIEMDVRQEYLSFLNSYKEDYDNLKIGVDLSNGMAGLLIKDVLGDSPTYIYEEMDGTFPNHEANPLVPENIRDLQQLVSRERCDIGVIFDGDADRVMFVDENSKFISPDLMIAVLGHYFLEEKRMRGAVLQDIRSSKSVGEYLAPMGAELTTWKVGRAFAARKLREIDGVFGGELAGHYYFRDFFYSDSGILAAIIILNVVAKMKRQGLSVSQLIAKISRYHSSGEVNFTVTDKRGAMEEIKNHFLSQEKPTSFMDFDGYRVEFPEWWFNIRPSNTEPYLRFLAEATTEELIADKVSVVKKILKNFQ